MKIFTKIQQLLISKLFAIGHGICNCSLFSSVHVCKIQFREFASGEGHRMRQTVCLSGAKVMLCRQNWIPKLSFIYVLHFTYIYTKQDTPNHFMTHCFSQQPSSLSPIRDNNNLIQIVCACCGWSQYPRKYLSIFIYFYSSRFFEFCHTSKGKSNLFVFTF